MGIGVAPLVFVPYEAMQLYATIQARIERNKVRMGMTINEVLPLVHGIDITVLPGDNDPLNVFDWKDANFFYDNAMVFFGATPRRRGDYG